MAAVVPPSPSGPSRDGARRRTRRLLPAAGLVLASLALGACGFDVQTNTPYTPGEGVNADVGTYETLPAVKVRNLMVLSREAGTGFLSATLYATDRDALTGVTAKAEATDGAPSGPVTVEVSSPVTFDSSGPLVLTDRTQIPVTGAVTPGYTVSMTLTFRSAGQLTIVVPVIDATTSDYATVTPSPAPSETPAS